MYLHSHKGADEPQSLILNSLHVPDRVASALSPSALYPVPSTVLLTPRLLPMRVASLFPSVTRPAPVTAIVVCC